MSGMSNSLFIFIFIINEICVLNAKVNMVLWDAE